MTDAFERTPSLRAQLALLLAGADGAGVLVAHGKIVERMRAVEMPRALAILYGPSEIDILVTDVGLPELYWRALAR